MKRYTLTSKDRKATNPAWRAHWRKQYRKRSPMKDAQYQQRIRLKRYGLTPEQYECILEAQDFCCAICHILLERGSGANAAHVDHAHGEKHVRGILCANCNKGLGMFKDSPWRCEAAASYLRKWQKR